MKRDYISDSEQENLDGDNATFWNELCGTGLAHSLGITDHSRESLERFDKAYFDIYPYLKGYVPEGVARDKRVLEIGLGFATLSQYLIESGADYFGLDISAGPVDMVRGRMQVIGRGNPGQVKVGSALKIPFDDASFDSVVSIGCLHHTGDLQKSIDEVCRVLVPGGTAVIMIYNARSFRQILFRLRHPSIWFRNHEAVQKLHANYDANSAGDAAPHIDYTSSSDLQRLFAGFSKYTYEKENADPIRYWKGRCISREKLLPIVGRMAGLDLYVTAVK